VDTGREEGWYSDPFGVHEARWYSEGRPTSLVRDGQAESRDAPPDRPAPQPEPLPEGGSSDGSDLRRADEADQAWDPKRASDVAMDVASWTGGGHF
jgi:hypothetical protein